MRSETSNLTPLNPLNRLDRTLLQLQAFQKKALIPFFTVGDPPDILAIDILNTMVAAGADIIELGMPFSDPMADGIVIQQSSERALQVGTNVAKVLALVELFRKNNQHTPIVLMGYANPIYQFGIEAFAQQAKQVGVDAVLIVDLPHGLNEWYVTLTKHQVACIYLVAPTTSTQRIQALKTYASGYIYYVSTKGVTGTKLGTVEHVEQSGNLLSSDSNNSNSSTLPKALVQQIKHIRQATDLSVMVGFGINTAAIAQQIGEHCDGVIIGSAIVDGLIKHAPNVALNWLYAFLQEVKIALQRP